MDARDEQAGVGFVRPYSDADLEPTFSLWRSVSAATYDFLAPHTEAEDRAYFVGTIVPSSDLYVYERGGAVLGYMALRPVDGEPALIDRLYVAVESQGQGVGTALLAHARQVCRGPLRLFTHQKNARACAFYERRGFRAIRYGISPPPESEPDVEYLWEPPQSAPRP